MPQATWWVTLALILAAFDAEGQETTPGAIELGPVVVTADRHETPLKDCAEIIEVVSGDDIRAMNATSTSELLEAVVGLNTESGTGSGYPKRSVVSLNAMPPQYVLVLVDGQKLLSEHIHTGQNVDLIPPEAIERIEIIKTAASAQYGSQAIGGVVNIITKPSAREARAKVYGSFGSQRSGNVGVAVATPVGERVHVSMFADWDRSDGVPVLAPAHRLDNMGYGRVSLLNHVDVALAPGWQAELTLHYFQNQMDWTDGPVHSRLLMPKAALHVDLGRYWRLTGSVAYSSWESEQSTEQNDLLTPQVFATWSAWGGRNQLTLGADTSYNWFQRTGLDATRTQWAWGVFAHDTLSLGDAWSLSASTRLDHVQDLAPVFSPKLAVLYRPIDEVGLRAAVSRGFRAPTVQDRFEQAYGHGGTALRFGNPDLAPETSTAFSLSVEALPHPTLELVASGSFHLVDDFVTPRYEGPWTEDPTKDKWMQANILRAWIYGVEGWGRWSPLPWLRLQAGYSYGGNRDESTDKQLQFHPGHALSGKVDLRFVFATHYRLNLFAKAVFRMGRSAWSWQPAPEAARDDEEGYITDLADYTLLDAGAEFGYRACTAFFTATNLLAEDIERLDDALTRLDGQPLYRVGLRLAW